MEEVILNKNYKNLMINIHHPLIRLKKIDSTNHYAEQLLKVHKLAEGTIIFAHDQTSGKGQGDNNWESEPGKNATFSLVLFPDFLKTEQQFLLNKLISLGVIDFLDTIVKEQKFTIKWPNDIYAGNRKIGGILIQNTICGSKFESCIAGIGLNINQMIFNSRLPNPVSLKQLTGMDYIVEDAVNLIVRCIDKRYLQLKNGSYEILDRDYQKRLLGINKWRYYTVDKMVIKGKIRGVNESGLLIVEMDNGFARSFNHGEIEFVFP